jgi:hypothetical protein
MLNLEVLLVGLDLRGGGRHNHPLIDRD